MDILIFIFGIVCLFVIGKQIFNPIRRIFNIVDKSLEVIETEVDNWRDDIKKQSKTK